MAYVVEIFLQPMSCIYYTTNSMVADVLAT